MVAVNVRFKADIKCAEDQRKLRLVAVAV